MLVEKAETESVNGADVETGHPVESVCPEPLGNSVVDSILQFCSRTLCEGKRYDRLGYRTTGK